MQSSAAKQREAGRVSGDDVFIYFGDEFTECIALVVWLTSLGWVSLGNLQPVHRQGGAAGSPAAIYLGEVQPTLSPDLCDQPSYRS